jgi:hemolysin III
MANLGLVHKALYMAVIPFFTLAMLTKCDTPTEFLSVFLYSLSSMMCFGISSRYHIGPWNAEQKAMMGKMDNIGIFFYMTFNASPVFLVLIPEVGIPTLCFITLPCLSSAVMILLTDLGNNRYLMSLYYWLFAAIILLFIVPAFAEAATKAQMIMWLISAASYVIGGLIYTFKWPDIYPDTLGFHVIFHWFTGLAAIFSSTVNYMVL